MTSLARGPAGAEPPGRARPADGTREPGGPGHPALRGLSAVWLRANCPCADCQDPGSGQRLAAITDLPADVTVAGVVASGTTVEVIFGPDGHRAVFATGWLARYGDRGKTGQTGRTTTGPRTPSACGRQPTSAAGSRRAGGRATWPTRSTAARACRPC